MLQTRDALVENEPLLGWGGVPQVVPWRGGGKWVGGGGGMYVCKEAVDKQVQGIIRDG